MKRLLSICLSLYLCMNTYFIASAETAKYFYPFTEVAYDRIDDNMPLPFSISNVEKELLLSENFTGNKVNNAVNVWKYGDWKFENDAIKIEKSDTSNVKQFALKWSNNTIQADEYYAFTCKIKSENNLTGNPRSILAAYDAYNNNLGEIGDLVGLSEPNSEGWYELFQVMKLPQGTTNVTLYAHVDSAVTGTFCYDEFKLYRLAINPLESVLVWPAYKGLIYGDTDALIDLDIIINETNGIYDAENMFVEVRLLNSRDETLKISKVNNLKTRLNVAFSMRGMPEGTYYVQTCLYDKDSGNPISKKEHTIRKVSEDYKPEFYIDKNGHTVKNGNKTFLKQIYHVEKDYTDVVENVLNAPIDNIMHGGMGWWYIDGDLQRDIPIEQLRAGGKSITLSFMGYWWGNRSNDSLMSKTLFKKQRDIRALMTAVINDRKNDSVLGSYYLFDEPDPILYGEEIRWNNEIISDLDLHHPTYGITDKMFDEYGIYTKMVDIVGIDPYPVSGNPENDDIARVGRSVREIKENFPNRPVYLCLQGFNWEEMYGSTSRGPNYEELRNMAYQAICEGAEGLDCYAYHEMKMDSSGKTFNEWWNEICTLYGDVEKYENIILSDEPSPIYNVTKSGEWLNITSRRYRGKSYIFAVNNTYANRETEIKIEGATSIKNLDTGENYSLNNSLCNLSFSPYEVKILEIEQTSYLSSEANLDIIGFFNCNNAYAVSEGDVNTLHITDDSVIINYFVNVSPRAKLFINGVEKPVSGKLSLKHSDMLCVSVVAEDGVTKTNSLYKIER